MRARRDCVLNAELGHYKPCFFEIVVNTDKQFRDYESYEQAVLIHEYVHFLQDISTTFGMINTSRTVDYIKSLMNVIKETPGPTIELPIDPEQLHHSIAINDRLFAAAYFGDNRNDLLFSTNPMIRSVEAHKENFGQGINTSIITVSLNFGGPIDTHLWRFGALTIAESMAHIIEQHIFPGIQPAVHLQYHLAELVAEFIYPNFATPINVLMLCDVSLLSYNPGETFYYILNEMAKEKKLPSSVEDFYDYALSCVKLPANSSQTANLIDLMNETAVTTARQIGELFTSPELAEIGGWAGDMVKRGAARRAVEPGFIAQLLKLDKGVALQVLLDMMVTLGLPVISNRASLSIAPRHSSKGIASPLLLPTMYDVYTMFRYGKSGRTSCNGITGCLSSPEPITVNELCERSPWERVRDDKGLCLFAQVCAMWGIPRDKQIILNG